jgi:hypothetical protein
VAELREHGFESAKQVVDVARFILSGEPAASGEAPAQPAVQATLEPSPDTVQKPAAE